MEYLLLFCVCVCLSVSYALMDLFVGMLLSPRPEHEFHPQILSNSPWVEFVIRLRVTAERRRCCERTSQR